MRLFITHGGLFSTQEAAYHGVPVLGMPVGLDQRQNMRTVQRDGWGRFLHWQDLTYDSLRRSILQIIDDSRYYGNLAWLVQRAGLKCFCYIYRNCYLRKILRVHYTKQNLL